MIENIQNDPVPRVIGHNSLRHADATNRRFRDDSDATLQVDFADLISQATEASNTDADAVRKAREMISSGRLADPENLRSVAEDIVSFGI